MLTAAHHRTHATVRRELGTAVEPKDNWRKLIRNGAGSGGIRRNPSFFQDLLLYIFDATLLKLPIMGTLLRKVAVAKFTRTLGTMIASGVPILDALDIVAKAANNKIIEQGIYFVRDKIKEGSNMADPLLQTGVFPSMVVQMIAVGESTGAMDTMLQKIADFYEDEVEVAVEGMTKLLEPLMMVFIGGIVGTILIAMYLPIFSVAGNVKS